MVGLFECYWYKLSGLFLDRIDIQVFVSHLCVSAMRDSTPGESSDKVRERVVQAREVQRRRLAPFGARVNAEMSPRAMRATCSLTSRAERELERLSRVRFSLTGRGIDRLIKLARTLADLDGGNQIDVGAIREAASYRALDAMHAASTGLGRPRPILSADATPAAS